MGVGAAMIALVVFGGPSCSGAGEDAPGAGAASDAGTCSIDASDMVHGKLFAAASAAAQGCTGPDDCVLVRVELSCDQDFAFAVVKGHEAAFEAAADGLEVECAGACGAIRDTRISTAACLSGACVGAER